MTEREQYIQERSTGEIDIEKAYKMYENSEVKNKIDLQLFGSLLQLFVNRSDMDKYWKYWDNEHSVMKLIDKNGSIRYL